MSTFPGLTEQIYADAAIAELFSGPGTLRKMLQVEAALARAQAQCGVVPAAAAQVIHEVCQAEDLTSVLDPAAIAADAVSAGNIAIPFVRQLAAAVARRDGDAARFVHWGATSQDILDTALVLQLQEALARLDHALHATRAACAALARAHRDTIMVGRTWLQHALPTTFGAKAAGWLDALGRSAERLRRAQAQTAVLQFGGAAGTLASLGSAAPAVSHALARQLGLALPAMPWHTQRDRLADMAGTLGVLTGTLGKMARDISLMAQTEIGELAEPGAPGRGGSSTMPHKRNPVGCAAVLAAAIRVPPLVSTILAGMVQEHERALGGWQAEWDVLPQIVALTGGALRNMNEVLEGLEVYADRMEQNLNQTRGLILAEAYALALAPAMGRLRAHELVEQASQDAVRRGCELRSAVEAAVGADEAAQGLLSDADLERLGNPAGYLGQSGAICDSALAQWDAERA